jgi:hypothetical protein
MRKRVATTDRALVTALAITFLLCLYGVAVRQMHPDAMAFLPLFAPGKLPFDPGWFEKPPFYPYCNYFLAVFPLSTAARVLHLSADVAMTAQIIWSRILLSCLLLGSAGLVFTITRRAYGTVAARAVAVVFVTSAGMVAFVHQLTADIPVMWWMLVAFHFSDAIGRDDRTSNYVLAGLCTGLATATKYNGLGVGVAIVVAHVLRAAAARPPRTWRAWRGIVLDTKLALGLVMVPVGFVLGNPFAILDRRTFKADFLYNYMVASVYEGQTGHSWGTFFLRIADIIGAPAFAAFASAGVIATWVVVRRRRLTAADATFWSTLAVCALYYVKFAPFPRLETRFVLPIVPFWMMLSAPCWAQWRRHATLRGALLGALVAYNVLCSAYVGTRFLGDPRTAAHAWVRDHVPRDAAVEYDIYSPVDKTARVHATTMPFVTGRERLFEQVFPGNSFINGSEATRLRAEERVSWYAVEALTRRAPDYVVIDSLYYGRFVEPGLRSDLYPSMREYFRALLAGESPYRIVFDRRSPPVPPVIYPREIDFLDNRATILAKNADALSAR